MPVYKIGPPEISECAAAVLCAHECYKAILNARVKIDYLVAFPTEDESHAMVKSGHRVLGQTRIVNLKDRVKGNGDAEILIDGEWWRNSSVAERAALLDHELYHIMLVTNKGGIPQTDDIGRPKLKLRPHDVQVGWFSAVAERNGGASVERAQALEIIGLYSQSFFPGFELRT